MAAIRYGHPAAGVPPPPASVLEYLVTGLGAVSDTLVLDNTASTEASSGPIAGSAGRYLPLHTIIATETGRLRASVGMARLAIPVFSVIIATNILRDGLGGDVEGLSPSEYEDANTAMILGVLNAHMWSAAFHSNSFEFDFRSFAPSVCKHTAMLSAPTFARQHLGRNAFDEWCTQNKMETINVRNIVAGHNGMAVLIGTTLQKIATYGIALLVAGDGAPLSGFTIITSLFIFGFEYNNRHNEGGAPIGIQSLQKRCYQFGFNCLRLNATCNTMPTSQKVLPPSLNAMVRNACGDAEVTALGGSCDDTICLTYRFQEAKTSTPFRVFHSYIRAWQRDERAEDPDIAPPPCGDGDFVQSPRAVIAG